MPFELSGEVTAGAVCQDKAATCRANRPIRLPIGRYPDPPLRASGGGAKQGGLLDGQWFRAIMGTLGRRLLPLWSVYPQFTVVEIGRSGQSRFVRLSEGHYGPAHRVFDYHRSD